MNIDRRRFVGLLSAVPTLLKLRWQKPSHVNLDDYVLSDLRPFEVGKDGTLLRNGQYLFSVYDERGLLTGDAVTYKVFRQTSSPYAVVSEWRRSPAPTLEWMKRDIKCIFPLAKRAGEAYEPLAAIPKRLILGLSA